MARTHVIEETIEDTLPNFILLKLLKDKGFVPTEWEFCSLHLIQESAGDAIQFIAKRKFNAPEYEQTKTPTA